jgi:hypothetical protein
VLRAYQREHPIAMRSLNDDLETCLAYLAAHWRIKTGKN